jgi:hypothetical protein
LSTSDASPSKTSLSSGPSSPTPHTALRRSQGAAAGEDGEASEQRLLTDVEEVVAPRDRVAQRLLPFWQVPRSCPEQPQPAIQPVEQRLRGEQFDPSGRQLDCQRQPVEPPADPCHRDRVGGRKLEAWQDGQDALAKEFHRRR